MRKLTIGSRGSALALRQTDWVAERLKSLHAGLEVEVRIIRTKGDRILDVPLAGIGDKGLFVKEIEQALLAGEIDVAVHSMKDLPTEIPEGLCIAAVPEREDSRDALISPGPGLAELPRGAQVGTSSVRRSAQIGNVRPDLEFADLRGNLDTRLRKLDEGEYDAIVLACAGLNRMGWAARVTERLSFDVCLPAVGQGALAVEARTDDESILELLAALDHAETHSAVLSERSLLRALGGGCQAPVGACAFTEGEKVKLMGAVASPEGNRVVRGELLGDPGDPESLGRELAELLLAGGAEEILKEMKGTRTE